MNRCLTATMLVLATAAVVSADDAKDRWIGNVDAALAAARKLDKPVFLTFRCER